MIFVTLVLAEASLRLYRFLAALDQSNITGASGIFGGSAGSGTTFSFIVTVALGLIMLGTAVSMTISGVVAIVELSRGVYIGWASKVAAIFASVAIVGLFLTFSYRVVVVFQAAEAMSELGEKVGREVDTSQLGYAIARMAGNFVLFAIVPLAVCVTGFARNMKR